MCFNVDAHFSNCCKLPGLVPVKEDGGGGGVRVLVLVLFRVVLAVSGGGGALALTRPPAHSQGTQCIFLLNELELCRRSVCTEY